MNFRKIATKTCQYYGATIIICGIIDRVSPSVSLKINQISKKTGSIVGTWLGNKLMDSLESRKI